MAAAIRKYVTFFLLALSEVTGVFENAALDKTAEMSSLYNNNYAGNAVDGDNRTFMHTAAEEKSAWWTVDLARMVQDPRVTLYFRTGNVIRRNYTKCYTSATRFTPINMIPQDGPCFAVTNDLHAVITRTCGGVWRYLMFYRDTESGYDGGYILDFAEVTVITCDVNSYSYADNCTKLCSSRHCAGTSVSCPSNTGACAEGCLPGWRGDDCATECLNSTYGPDCNRSCSSRHCFVPSQTCDHVTGECGDGGCQDGYNGTDCTEECNEGVTYGANCELLCSDRRCVNQTSECHPTNGTCPHGCAEGWVGHDCILELDAQTIIPAESGVVAALLVTVIIVGAVVCYIRRKSNHSKNDRNVINTSKNANVYMNVDVEQDENIILQWNTRRVNIEDSEKRSCEASNNNINKDKKGELPNVEVYATNDEEHEVVDDACSVHSDNYDYYNDSEVFMIREVSVDDLEATIQKVKATKDGFMINFNRLPSGFTASYDDSQRPENSKKNKFKGYYPYDHNRVRLSLIPDIPGSDYINASILHSYDKRKTYLAAQAPNKHTYGDFLRMIWEQDCRRVIMLTGLEEKATVKCYKYWPDNDEELLTDHLKVKVTDTDVRADYTIRYFTLQLKKTGETRSVVQYHYTSWPDHGVPDILALVNSIWRKRQICQQEENPMLVHCSAGIGRTGTYIAVDSVLDQAREEGVLDVPGYVCAMREQRKNMIQTKEQYECVFECLLEMTKFGNTSMDVDNFTTSYSNRGMDSMVDRKTLREITQMILQETPVDDDDKHRMWVDGNQHFMIRVGPSSRNLLGFLQTLSPSQNQEKLLWKLVEENNVHNIIAISTLERPLIGEKGSVKKYGKLAVTSMDKKELDSGVLLTTLKLQTGQDHPRTVKLFQYVSPATPTVDSLSSSLLSNLQLQQISDETNPVVIIHSEPDRHQAAMICMMCNTLSGVLQDRCVDVLGHVRRFYSCSPGLTLTQNDIESLFKFAQTCILTTDSSSTYANM